MDREAVCQYHIFICMEGWASPGQAVYPPMQYPRVLLRDAERMGWKWTSDRLFCPPGVSSVLICPDCVRWQEDYYAHGPLWLAPRGLLYPWQVKTWGFSDPDWEEVGRSLVEGLRSGIGA